MEKFIQESIMNIKRLESHNKVLAEQLKIAIQGLEAIISESNDAIAVKIAEDTLEIIN